MNAATAILDYVGRVGKIDRDALIAEIEREHDPKLVSPTVSTMLRRGELQELPNGHITLGSDEAIEQARQDREQRKQQRDRPTMPPPSPTPHVAPVPEKPRPGSSTSALRNCTAIRNALEQHGAMRAIDLAKRVDILGGESNVYYHANQMHKRGELLKQDGWYAVRPEQFDRLSPVEVPAEPTKPDIDVAAALDELDAIGLPRRERVRTIADVVRRHATAAPEEHVLQLGDVYIAVTAPAAVASRVLSAALAVLGEPA